MQEPVSLFTPEAIFIANSNSNIGPVGPADVADCLISRTEAILISLVSALEGGDKPLIPTIVNILWQVEGNIEMLKHLNDKYMPV